MSRCAGLQLAAYVRRQAECAAIRHRGDADIRRQKYLRLAPNPLREFGRCAADADHRCLDDNDVVHARGLQKIDMHGAHDKAEDGTRTSGMNRRLMDVERTQELGAPTFEKAQIGCVINGAGKIRIFIIDANGMAMWRQRSLLFGKEAELGRRARRLGKTEMAEGVARQDAAARRAL